MTTAAGTEFEPGWQDRPDARLVLAHEAVHAAQLRGKGTVTRDRQSLEAEAVAGSRAFVEGLSFTPTLAAPQSAVLAYGPEAWLPDPEATARREAASLPAAALTDPDAATRVNVASTQSGGGAAHAAYRVDTTAGGPDGAIRTTTSIELIHDPNATATIAVGPMIRPLGGELGLYQGADVPAYPYEVRYSRHITYSDTDGRQVTVSFNGSVWLSAQTVEQQMAFGAQPSFEALVRLVGDEGIVGVHLEGGGPVMEYRAGYWAQQTSVTEQVESAVRGFGATTNAGSDVTAPATFIDLLQPAGVQYTSLRSWLTAMDAIELARRMVTKAPTASGSEDSLLDEILDSVAGLLGWVSDALHLDDLAETIAGLAARFGELMAGIGGAIAHVWESLPAWARGILTAVAKLVGGLAVMALIAGAIVLAAKGAIAFGAAMLVVGLVALGATFLYSLYQRTVEWWHVGDPLEFFFIGIVALLDTVGLSGIIEAVTDESLLTGTTLNRTEEQRWEGGTTGVFQLVGTFFLVRALRTGTPTGRGGQAAELRSQGQMRDFHNLPPERLPTNLPEGYYWQRSPAGEWVLMRDPTAPEVPIELSIYSDGQGRINYNVRTGDRAVQSEAMTRPEGVDPYTGPRLPESLAAVGQRNPYREPGRARPWDKGHGVDYADTLEGPGVRNSSTDPMNFVPQASWWNQHVRNPLVGRIRGAGGGYREMPLYDAVPSRTVNGTPIPRAFIFVETSPQGVPLRAWRIPNDPALSQRGLDVLPQYEIPLAEIPQVMLEPSGALRPPGTRWGPVAILGESGDEEAADVKRPTSTETSSPRPAR